jgi:DNA-binding NarL/FixJ family response regulator
MFGSVRGTLRRITILIVGSPPLARVIGHLFLRRTEIEVVGAVKDLGRLGPTARKARPDLIVVNVKLVSTRMDRMVTAIKRHCPLSKLLLISPIEDLASVARQCGADAYLKDEKLARQLVRIARTLSARQSMTAT